MLLSTDFFEDAEEGSTGGAREVDCRTIHREQSGGGNHNKGASRPPRRDGTEHQSTSRLREGAAHNNVIIQVVLYQPVHRLTYTHVQ